MQPPVITPRYNGEYSTVTLHNGTIETCWFPDDTSQPSRVIDRSVPSHRSVESIARMHIREYEANK